MHPFGHGKCFDLSDARGSRIINFARLKCIDKNCFSFAARVSKQVFLYALVAAGMHATKLQIHGRLGLIISHAILENRFVDSDSTTQSQHYQMLE